MNVTIDGGETYSEATTLSSGLMSSADKTKLNGIAANANYYTLPTASTDTKGGIKVGTGLSMNGDTLNATLSEATVFTGATGLAGGSSGLVPAPSAGDNAKFLRGDGTWATVSGGGQTYSVATTTQAGLMSAEDKQHLDAVFQDSTNLTDAVITVVGGKFAPSVDSASDFITYKDSNLPYWDNKLYRVMHGIMADSSPIPNQEFLNGEVVVYTEKSGPSWRISSSNGTYCTVATDNSTLETNFESDPYKLSETAGFFVRHSYGRNGDYLYDRFWCIDSFQLNSEGKITAGTINVSICSAVSNVASAEGWNEIDSLPSMTNPNYYLFLATIGTATSNTVYYTSISFNGTNGVQLRTSGVTILAYYKATPKGTTSLIPGLFPTQYFPTPTFSFSDDKVTVEENTSHKRAQPFVVYSTGTYASNGALSAQRDYALLHHGFAVPSLYPYQTYNYDTGSNTLSAPWLTKDGGVIAGVWQTCRGEIYAVTFKPGVYDYSATWFDDCSTVWTFDFKTPQVFKTNKKLSQVIDDFIF